MSGAKKSLPIPAEAIDPGIGLGDVLALSGLIGKLLAAFVAVEGTPPGGSATLPDITTWLPVGGGETWDLSITGTRKK